MCIVRVCLCAADVCVYVCMNLMIHKGTQIDFLCMLYSFNVCVCVFVYACISIRVCISLCVHIFMRACEHMCVNKHITCSSTWETLQYTQSTWLKKRSLQSHGQYKAR